MNAEIAEEQAQEERYPFLFRNIGKSVRVVVYVDGRLLCSLWRFSRLSLLRGFWQQRRNANGGSVVYRAFDRLRGVFDKPNALFAVKRIDRSFHFSFQLASSACFDTCFVVRLPNTEFHVLPPINIYCVQNRNCEQSQQFICIISLKTHVVNK